MTCVVISIERCLENLTITYIVQVRYSTFYLVHVCESHQQAV